MSTPNSSAAVRVWTSCPLAKPSSRIGSFDLRVVGGDEHAPWRGDEGTPDLATQLGANGDVLHVRVARGEASRGRHGLVVRSVKAPGLGVHHRWQRVHVRRLELGDAAVLEQLAGNRVQQSQLLEHVGVGGEPRLGLAHGRKLEPFEEQLA